MDCEICGKKLATTFMEKLIGTYVKDSKGKKHSVCFECQHKFAEKSLILQHLR